MTISKPISQEHIMSAVKYGFAFIIILMGAIGYYRFFNNGGWSFSLLSIVFLFVVVEIAIMTITTIKFSSYIKQDSKINLSLYLSIFVMWVIASVGIDSTIWHMVEDKYEQVKVDKAVVQADKINLSNLDIQLKDLKKQREQLIIRQDKIEVLKSKTFRQINRYDTNIRGIIYSVANCNESADCLERKNSAIENKKIAQDTLNQYNQNLKDIRSELLANKQTKNKIQSKIDAIKNRQANFEKDHRVTVENQVEESVTHIWLMNFINKYTGANLDNPQRAFVMTLSFVVYPIYILFIAFASSNTTEMKKIREIEQLNKKEKTRLSKLLISLLRKNIHYLISTRKRKIKEIEIEVEKEVEVEVEKLVYKDGKEIVKVEVEKPIVIDQEKIVEKIVHVPVVEKEFVVVPTGTDLNKLNELSKSGIVPDELSDILDNDNTQTKDKKIVSPLKGFNNDKHKSA